MKINTLILLLIAFFALSSCNKDKEDPIISITSPENNKEIAAGDKFALRATVTDNEALSSILVTDGGSINETITSFDELTSHQINYLITINADSDPGEIKFSITANDLEGNSATEEVTIIIK